MPATATVANVNGNINKRNSLFQVGLEKMKDADVLGTAYGSLSTLVDVVTNDKDKAFDLLYVNMPWKTISVEEATKLPVQGLVQGKDHAGLLLWVDGPCVDKASKVLDAWGFKFHSILHVTSYVNPSTPSAPAAPAAPAAAAAAPGEESSEDNIGNANAANANANATSNASVTEVGSVRNATPKKALVPHGWVVDGIVPSKSRQLWFAVQATEGADGAAAPYLKDPSFIRKRIQAMSTFEYSKLSEGTYAPLSSKKKNLDTWVVFPEYTAYVPADVETALEAIHKPATRVLSLFADTVNRSWHTWGPNVPGYVSCPMRPDGGFPVVNALLKYFNAMKGATVQKYLTLINLYVGQYAKHLGSAENPSDEDVDEDGNPRQYLTPLVSGRMQDFMTDLVRKYKETGGIKACDTSKAGVVPFEGLDTFGDLSPILQAHVLLLVGQVIRAVLRKNAEATERRKRAIKRKRENEGEEESGEQQRPRVPRKYGIAAPVDISDELSSFMGLAPGDQVARTTVVKYINEYISKNNLQNPQRRSEIMCDAALLKLLKPGDNFTVNYFNLCRLLGPHFRKAAEDLAGKGGAAPPPAAPAPAVPGAV